MKGLNHGYYSRRINQQKAVTGFVFSLPFIIGIIFLFCVPLSQSLVMAFSNVSVVRESGLHPQWNGIENFVYAFREHATFSRDLVDAFLNMAKTCLLYTSMSAAWLLGCLSFPPSLWKSITSRYRLPQRGPMCRR